MHTRFNAKILFTNLPKKDYFVAEKILREF